MALYWFTIAAIIALLALASCGYLFFRVLFAAEIEERRIKKRRERMPPCVKCRNHVFDDGYKMMRKHRCIVSKRDEVTGETVTKPCEEIRGTKLCMPRFEEENDAMPYNDCGGAGRES